MYIYHVSDEQRLPFIRQRVPGMAKKYNFLRHHAGEEVEKCAQKHSLFQNESIGAPWWLNRLRIWHYHCCGSGHCCGKGLMPSGHAEGAVN